MLQRRNLELCYAMKILVELGESASVTFQKLNVAHGEHFFIKNTSFSTGKNHFWKAEKTLKMKLAQGDLRLQKLTKTSKD